MPLFSRVSAPDWSAEDDPTREAKCRKFATPTSECDPWFDDHKEALAVCNGELDGIICPMRSSCLSWAMKNCERFGVWGGMLPHDRQKLRQKYRNKPEKWKWHAPTPKPPERRSSDARRSPPT